MVENNKSNKISILDIKSKYILQHIFFNLQEVKLLNIIRYNKNIQDKLNKDIKDYIKYAKIEIEVYFRKNNMDNSIDDIDLSSSIDSRHFHRQHFHDQSYLFNENEEKLKPFYKFCKKYFHIY